MRAHGWLLSYIYQPADCFWRFQITETLISLARRLKPRLKGLPAHHVRLRGRGIG